MLNIKYLLNFIITSFINIFIHRKIFNQVILNPVR